MKVILLAALLLSACAPSKELCDCVKSHTGYYTTFVFVGGVIIPQVNTDVECDKQVCHPNPDYHGDGQ